MRYAPGLAAAAGAATLALSGCGQKGPLYLPEKGAAVVRPSPATPAAAPQTPAPQPTAAPSTAAPAAPQP